MQSLKRTDGAPCTAGSHGASPKIRAAVLPMPPIRISSRTRPRAAGRWAFSGTAPSRLELRNSKGLSSLLSADESTLLAEPGIGPAQLARLRAAGEAPGARRRCPRPCRTRPSARGGGRGSACTAPRPDARGESARRCLRQPNRHGEWRSGGRLFLEQSCACVVPAKPVTRQVILRTQDALDDDRRLLLSDSTNADNF